MSITQREMESVKAIILDGAKTHFPPPVQFHDANVTVRLDAYDEEFLDVELLYTAPNPVLDGRLMNTLFRVIDEPIIAAGVTARTMIRYVEINDPTRWRSPKKPVPPAAAP